MIGIGTIGRAAESGGGSTTYQNGQYIALSFYGYVLYSSDFGQTFVKKACPRGAVPSILGISSIGEVLIRVYQNEIYYLSDINSNWTTIINGFTRIDSVCASYDFSVIVYTPYEANYYQYYYYSSNKGVSFTRYTYTPYVSNQIIRTSKLSGDGKIAVFSIFGSSSGRSFIAWVDVSRQSTSFTKLVESNVNDYTLDDIFVSYTGAIKGWSSTYLGGNYPTTYTIYGIGSYNNVRTADSEDGVNIYYYNKSDYNMYKTPSTVLFNTGNISNLHIYTVTNGSNQVFYTINGSNFKVYSSTGTLLYTTVYPNSDTYGAVSAAISRVIP